MYFLGPMMWSVGMVLPGIRQYGGLGRFLPVLPE